MKKQTQPLKVTCRLYDGRINSMDGLIYLDSILYHAWFRKHRPEVFNGTAKQGPDFAIGLPLSREVDGTPRRYLASLGFYRQYDQRVEYWNKRSDFTSATSGKYLNERGKIDTGAGQLKAYHMPNVIRTVSDIEFYCVGNLEKVRELLSLIPAIGKKPAEGWGRVHEWVVEPFEEDWSTEGGYGLMRPMPVDQYAPPEGSHYQVRSVAVFPPSWAAKNQQICWVPEVMLK